MRERTKRRYRRYWRNLKEVKWNILWRFLTLMIMSIVFSTFATLLNLKGVLLNSRETLMSGLLGMCFCFLFLDIVLMRKDYYRLTHKRKYRMVNYISHSAYALVNLVMCHFFSHSYAYAFVFSITKFARYTHIEFSPAVSALFFHAILIVAIRYAPIGMKWLHMHHG